MDPRLQMQCVLGANFPPLSGLRATSSTGALRDMFPQTKRESVSKCVREVAFFEDLEAVGKVWQR